MCRSLGPQRNPAGRNAAAQGSFDLVWGCCSTALYPKAISGVLSRGPQKGADGVDGLWGRSAVGWCACVSVHSTQVHRYSSSSSLAAVRSLSGRAAVSMQTLCHAPNSMRYTHDTRIVCEDFLSCSVVLELL